jgi:SAM-dependent methyltransferase
LVVVGLLAVEDGLFANTAESDYYLVRGRQSYWGDRHKVESDLWIAALQIAESIQAGKPQAAHDYESMSEDELEEFLGGLHFRAYTEGVRIARNYDFSSCQTVADVGGGTCGIAIGLAGALPHLHVTILELPSVVPVAWRFVERAGVAERVQVQTVDVVNQPLKDTFDVALLKAFIQVLSLEEAHQALSNVHMALKTGGTIYISDLVLDDSRLTPPNATLFSPVYVTIYEHGQNRTVQEYRDLVAEAGFEGFEFHADRIITARKSAHAHSSDASLQ